MLRGRRGGAVRRASATAQRAGAAPPRLGRRAPEAAVVALRRGGDELAPDRAAREQLGVRQRRGRPLHVHVAQPAGQARAVRLRLREGGEAVTPGLRARRERVEAREQRLRHAEADLALVVMLEVDARAVPARERAEREGEALVSGGAGRRALLLLRAARTCARTW